MLTLQKLKRQCRVDFDDDDELLQSLLESALQETIERTNRSEEELQQMSGGAGLPLPLEQATLMLAAQYYANPEGDVKPSPLYYSLIRLYQKI